MPVRLRVRAEGLDEARRMVAGQQRRASRVMRGIAPGVFHYMRRGIAQYFRRQAGPDGPWPPLAASTVERKGHSIILVETRRLRESLTGRSRYSLAVATALSIRYGTCVDYAQYHETGTRHMPRRGFMPYGRQVSEFVVRRAAENVLNYPPGTLGGPSGFQR